MYNLMENPAIYIDFQKLTWASPGGKFCYALKSIFTPENPIVYTIHWRLHLVPQQRRFRRKILPIRAADQRVHPRAERGASEERRTRLAWPVAAALVVDRRSDRSPLQTSMVDSINIVGNSKHITSRRTRPPADSPERFHMSVIEIRSSIGVRSSIRQSIELAVAQNVH